VAAVLSLVIPGAGQMYKGQVFNGLLWLVVVAIGYFMLIVPGLILHLLCILGAASGKPKSVVPSA
jgi:TM2 domain-containing membrane protein YozV